MISHIFCIATVLLCETIYGKVEDRELWLNVGKARLKEQVKIYRTDVSFAKNVIIFVGEGMGLSTITASRMYKAQMIFTYEGVPFSFERLVHIGLARIYSVDKQVPDEAAAATAMFTGVKTRNGLIGLSAEADSKTLCLEDNYKKSRLSSIAEWAVKGGKSVGLVTTNRVTSVTTAALYAHSPYSEWECEIPQVSSSCVKPLAYQLVQDFPGKEFKVILGGGRQKLGLAKTGNCNNVKGVLDMWKEDKENAKYVTTRDELNEIDTDKVEYLLGLFSDDNMAYQLENKDKSQPTLLEMVQKARKILKHNKRGYVLFVIHGLISEAHKMNRVKLALEETIQFDKAVKYADDTLDKEDTLLIVTANFGHDLNMLGYPNRGTNLLSGTEEKWKTLFYSTGPAVASSDPDLDTSSVYYQGIASYSNTYAVSSGADVPVYSAGAGSELLSGTYEQNFIAHVVFYIAKISENSANVSCYFDLLVMIFVIIPIYLINS